MFVYSFQFVVLFAVVALVAAGGDRDVDASILARVAQILSENEASGGSGGASSLVDGSLLSRVSQIIAASEGSSSGGSGGYDAPPPPPPSSSYGAPSRSASSLGNIQLGQPERAERVGEFSISSQGARSSSGGYN